MGRNGLTLARKSRAVFFRIGKFCGVRLFKIHTNSLVISVNIIIKIRKPVSLLGFYLSGMYLRSFECQNIQSASLENERLQIKLRVICKNPVQVLCGRSYYYFILTDGIRSSQCLL